MNEYTVGFHTEQTAATFSSDPTVSINSLATVHQEKTFLSTPSSSSARHFKARGGTHPLTVHARYDAARPTTRHKGGRRKSPPVQEQGRPPGRIWKRELSNAADKERGASPCIGCDGGSRRDCIRRAYFYFPPAYTYAVPMQLRQSSRMNHTSTYV